MSGNDDARRTPVELTDVAGRGAPRRGAGTGIERPIASWCVKTVDARPLGRVGRTADEILRILKGRLVAFVSGISCTSDLKPT